VCHVCHVCFRASPVTNTHTHTHTRTHTRTDNMDKTRDERRHEEKRRLAPRGRGQIDDGGDFEGTARVVY